MRLRLTSRIKAPSHLGGGKSRPNPKRQKLLGQALSRSTWLTTSLSPGSGEKLSKHAIEGGDVSGLLAWLAELRRKALARTGTSYPIIVIEEAGLDGFWLHRVLEAEGCESHVVDPASIAAPRRQRAKTDRLDGEALLRALLAYKRGEPRVCSMVRPPTPEAEDERRICRERGELIEERVRHVNRIKGLLFSQGVGDYEPLRRDRRTRIVEMRAGDGRPLGEHLRAQILCELDRLELLLEQIRAVEREREALLADLVSRDDVRSEAAAPPAPVGLLTRLKGIGPEFAASRWTEGLCRSFANRRQAGAYGGLTPTPWRSGSIDHEQGVSKAGNPPLTQDNAAIGLAVAHPSAAIGAGALASPAASRHERQGRAQAADRRARPQAVRRPVEVHPRRRRHRGRRHESLRLKSRRPHSFPSAEA